MPGRQKELSWSLSRARMFEECPRRFYYHNYLSKFGYAPDAPEEARLALEMRSIKGLDMWAGEIVHEAIQWTLEQARDGACPSAQEVRASARQKLSQGWQASMKRLWRDQPGDECPNLFEHYYGIPIGQSVTDRIKQKTFLCIDNFLSSSLLKHIGSTPHDRWLPIDKYASFRLDGLLFYVKFDFALKNDDGITVYDWKTGKPTEAESRQLACYALYTSSKWEVSLGSITVCAVHLQPELDAMEKLVDADDVTEARTFVKQTFNGMVRCLRDPARNLAAMDDFPMTGNLLRCVRCSFRGICIQGKQAAGDVDDLPIAEDWAGERQSHTKGVRG